MNKNTIKCAVIFTVLMSAMLSACDNQPAQPPFSQAPLAGARIGGAFTLIDQDGKARSDAEFAGKFRMVYFGYTSCPDVCQPDMQNLMAGLRLYEKDHAELANKIQPFFITVDPGRDRPDKLKQFVSAFHPRLIGLTGTPADIAKVTKEFAVVASRVPGGTDESYTMSHSQTPYLMGPDGAPLDLLPVDDPGTQVNEGSPSAVADTLSRWVR
jgi:protein SCO1